MCGGGGENHEGGETGAREKELENVVIHTLAGFPRRSSFSFLVMKKGIFTVKMVMTGRMREERSKKGLFFLSVEGLGHARGAVKKTTLYVLLEQNK